MGQSTSLPERIHRAAKANDVPELQSLCQELRRSGADRQARSAAFNWSDLEGRTGLSWAASKNFLAVAQLLLQEGADIHLVAPKRATGGSALAEAVAGRHESMVELLLGHGACPFTENSAGKTPLDLALELRLVAILRCLERYALFAGVVNMKVLQMKGFSHAAKDRWVVVAPRFTPPSGRSSAIGVVRVTMLIFRNAAEAEPRTKVWLDGASIFRSGNDAVLRLHPNHEQPRNAFTKFDRGWMLFFKQAAAASNAGGAAASAAAATFAAFMVICSRPLEQLQQQQQLRAAGAPCPVDALSSHLAAGAISAANPWQQQGQQQPSQQQQQQQHAAWPSAHLAAGQNPFAGNTGGTPSNPQQQQQQQQQQAARPYPPPQQQQQQQAFFNAGVQLQAAAAPPAAAQGAADAGALQAGPGESDEEFARRLAVTLGGSSGSDPRATGSGTTTTSAGSRTGSQTAAQQWQPQPPQSPPAAAATGSPAGGGMYPALPAFEPQQGDAAAAPSAPMAPAPAGSAQQQAFSDNPFRAGGAVAAVAASVQQPQQQLQQPAAQPVAAGVTGGSAASVAGPDADADMCVICLSNQREVGLLHGDTLHRCVCKACAPLMSVGSPCPMCRARIERVIGVF